MQLHLNQSKANKQKGQVREDKVTINLNQYSLAHSWI